MFQSIVFSVLFVSLVAGAAVPETQGDVKADLVLISDASQLKALKQRAELIPIKRVDTKTQIRYTVGNRIAGDRLVSQNSDYYQWSTATDILLELQYPASGTGAIVTFVEIVVNQSSNLGRAYIMAGGIGQRRIVIAVEAYSTLWFNYIANIFGV